MIDRREQKRQYRQANKERIREYNRAYTAANRETVRTWWREWEQKNKEQRDAYREARKEIVKETQRRTRANCYDRVLAANRAYQSRAGKTAPWANRQLIKDIYTLARIFREAGFDCHVDHVVPLRGKLVSGLHCEANLQIIPAVDNCRKHNTWRIE